MNNNPTQQPVQQKVSLVEVIGRQTLRIEVLNDTLQQAQAVINTLTEQNKKLKEELETLKAAPAAPPTDA